MNPKATPRNSNCPARPLAPLASKSLWSVLVYAALLTFLCAGTSASADYFPKSSFRDYRSEGPYPFWNSSWLSLDPRLRFDAKGIPVVEYGAGTSYNPVTVAAFGLLAYNRFQESAKAADRESFLKMADWLVAHQDLRCGCWFYDFDFNYVSLHETIPKPWVSAMGQGLAISTMTRAYSLTNDHTYLRTAERALLPYRKNVEEGGVRRILILANGSPVGSGLVFYEEYPTRRTPSFTLNGFMFALVGLRDLAQLNDADAAALFREGMLTLPKALPLYDLNDGSSYDLGHLADPPRPVHRDEGYHLIHITLLNALASSTGDPTLAWYRDRWNSYGTSLGTYSILLKRATWWLLRRQPALFGILALLSVTILGLLIRSLWTRNANRPESAVMHQGALSRHEAVSAAPRIGTAS